MMSGFPTLSSLPTAIKNVFGEISPRPEDKKLKNSIDFSILFEC